MEPSKLPLSCPTVVREHIVTTSYAQHVERDVKETPFQPKQLWTFAVESDAYNGEFRLEWRPREGETIVLGRSKDGIMELRDESRPGLSDTQANPYRLKGLPLRVINNIWLVWEEEMPLGTSLLVCRSQNVLVSHETVGCPELTCYSWRY